MNLAMSRSYCSKEELYLEEIVVLRNLLCAMALTSAGIAAPANAEVVLGSVGLFFGFAAETTEQSLMMGFGMIADRDYSNPAKRLFALDQTVVGVDDVGTTWVASGDTAAAIRAQFADDDLIDGLGFYAYLGVNDISGRVEEGDFGGDLDIDLIGQQMDEMRVTLLMWDASPHSQPGWTSFLFRIQYEFVSTIPAPGAGVMFGAVGLLAMRRRR